MEDRREREKVERVVVAGRDGGREGRARERVKVKGREGQEGGEEGGDRVTEESKKIYDTTTYKSDWCLHQYCIS